VHSLGAEMKLLGLRALVVTQSSLDTAIPLASGPSVSMLQTMEYDMKDGWTIEEYLEYVKHLLEQAEEDGYTL